MRTARPKKTLLRAWGARIPCYAAVCGISITLSGLSACTYFGVSAAPQTQHEQIVRMGTVAAVRPALIAPDNTNGLEITVLLDNGETRVIAQAADVPIYTGQRVRLVSGSAATQVVPAL